MVVSRTHQLAILQRRQRVAELYLQGRLQWQIGQEVGCTQQTVCNDLAAIRKEWVRSAVMCFEERQAQELAKIDRIEVIAEAAWRRSCEDAEIKQRSRTKGRTTPDGTTLPDLIRNQRIVRGQAGDPRFLERMAWCVEMRTKILGILSALKVHFGGDKDAPPIKTDATVQVAGELTARLEHYGNVFDKLTADREAALSDSQRDGTEQPLDSRGEADPPEPETESLPGL